MTMMMTMVTRSRAREVMRVVQALCLLTAVLAEPFHQRRDHRDQDLYLHSRGNNNVVRDRDDAKFVLSKYGYLRCHVQRMRRETYREGRGSPYQDRNTGSQVPHTGYSSWVSSLSEERGTDMCDDAEVQQAIREYQSNYNLAPTGVLDEETKRLMSTSRCGNKDNEDTPAEDANTDDGSQTDSPNSVSNLDQSLTPSAESSSHGHSNTRPGENHRLWRRAANRIRSDDPSHLLRILKGAAKKTRQERDSRHRRHLEDYASKLARDRLASKEPWSEEKYSRAKRSIQVTATGNGQNLANRVQQLAGQNGEDSNSLTFNKELIRWRLLTTGYSTRIPVTDQRATLDLAFRMWSEVIPLRFVEDTESSISVVDIEIAFGRGSHQGCQHDFDGHGGEIAHSQNAGNMHFDDEENYKSGRTFSTDGIYLLHVAVHEIGHVLGLAHTNRSESIMYAIYHGAQHPDLELSREDRRMVQRIYGVCKGQFNTVFDWVRQRPDNQFIYNTYFFRNNHYWMYENHSNRTRYGDPLFIARLWEGVPDNLDGYAHVWYRSNSGMVNEAFFFKGEHYYKYDSENDRVYEGWPRLIADDFRPKPGQTEAIPDNLDSVFFDMRDQNIYFFKDDMVYVYDPKEPEDSRGCCVRKRRIIEEFPPAPNTNMTLEDNLDAVYYSLGEEMQYFFKGEDVWKNPVFDPRQSNVVNSLEYMGKWYNKWVDICDVQIH